jgi:penicillin-binding protein 2
VVLAGRFLILKSIYPITKTQEIQTACKTGTAESQSKESLPHAWITVFAPFENPEIVLTVFLENAGQGSDVAGPIAKEILKSYFERRE